MKILYIYRSKKTKRFSIEKVFDTIRKKISIENEVYYAKYHGTNIIKMLINIFLVRKQKADIYHITGDVHYVILGIPKRKTILTIHDFVSLKNASGVKKFILKKLWFEYPIKFAKVITVISNKTKDELLSYFPWAENKVVVIHNPVSDLFSRRKYDFNSSCPNLLQIGTKENKNLENVIMAIKDLTVKLTILGVLTEKQLNLLKINKINFANYYNIDDEQVVDLYAKSDILVFVSLYEGFGLPIIEANSIGRPVITSDIEPMKSIGNDSVILVNPNNASEITLAINSIAGNKDLRNDLISKGLENAEKFRALSIAKEYERLYYKY